MKETKRYLFLMIAFTFLTACRIDSIWLLDSEATLIIQSHQSDENSTTREIVKGDETYSKIQKWLEQNEKGWEPSPASYMPGVEVRGQKFVLNFIPGGAVLNFRTPDGKYHQYVKEISQSEFQSVLNEFTTNRSSLRFVPTRLAPHLTPPLLSH